MCLQRASFKMTHVVPRLFQFQLYNPVLGFGFGFGFPSIAALWDWLMAPRWDAERWCWMVTDDSFCLPEYFIQEEPRPLKCTTRCNLFFFNSLLINFHKQGLVLTWLHRFFPVFCRPQLRNPRFFAEFTLGQCCLIQRLAVMVEMFSALSNMVITSHMWFGALGIWLVWLKNWIFYFAEL